MDATGRYFTKAVDAYWGSKPTSSGGVSEILVLTGVMDTAPVLGGTPTDTFALIMSYEDSSKSDTVVLSTPNESGNWVNAVSENIGGTSNFVSGPCDTSYPLGTYGFDTTSKTAWAILNYNGAFAVVKTV